MANTYKALSTVTVGAGGASSISFTNIPATYTDLKLVLSARAASTAANWALIGINGGSDTAVTLLHVLNNSNSVISQTYSSFRIPINQNAYTANSFANAELYFPNYASNSNKTMSSDGTQESNTSGIGQQFAAYKWDNTAPITSLTLTVDGGGNFAQYSTATIYGVFNADVSTAPATPTIGTATAGSQQASITFTPVSNAASYTMTSTPGNITATGTTSPIVVTGLTNGTSYTFKVKANNPFGSSAESAASNSVTPAPQNIPLLGAWTTAGTTAPSTGSDSYYGWVTVGGAPRVFTFGASRSDLSYYNDGFGGTWTQSGAARPAAQGLGSSSKSLTNSNLFYTYGGDTGTQTLVYSTATGASWVQQNSVSYNAGWSDGCYFEQGGNKYLIAVGEYPTGVLSARATVNNDGTLSWGNITNYPTYASAPRAVRLSEKPIIMGGFTSTSLSARQALVYSYSASLNTFSSETSLPFTPGGGYVPAFGLVGPVDMRAYVANGTSLWSRGDSSGTWRSETATPGNWSVGWGTVTSGGSYRVQVTSTSATYFQTVI